MHLSSLSKPVESLERCIDDMMIWMLRKRLKINEKKTKMMIFPCPNVKLSSLSTESHQPAGQVINQGVTLDRHLTMEAHIKRVRQDAYFQLKAIRNVENVLSPEAIGRLVHAFVTSRLHYCDSILVGIR